MLSGCGAEEAEQKREELQRAIDAVFFEARPGKRLRSASASAPPSSRTTAIRTKSLLATADSRMYQNKAARKRRAREEDAAPRDAAAPRHAAERDSLALSHGDGRAADR